MNYEAEIEQLNEERKKAAERINELMKMRDVKNNLKACESEAVSYTHLTLPTILLV